ncbi:MAG: deoxyhypusine synthase [Euryarchaeota archaeon]|nr:deoxyhypusine synthase [Euryarchaeota archaeon]
MAWRRPVEDFRIFRGIGAAELSRQMEASGGFGAKHLAQGVDILAGMLSDGSSVNFLSFPACINATGTRGIIRDMVRRKLFDAVITTCGTLDHDLARIWKRYYHGEFELDDALLRRKGINRLGNVLVPNESYGIVLERRLQPIFRDIYRSGLRRPSTRELLWAVGERLSDEGSILHWAARNRVPVFVPGITDGAFGCQLWMFYQEHRDFSPDLLADEQELSGLVMGARRSGALIIGGGISKHHTIWWNQFKDGLDYAVYLTTATERDGSLSGARVREAVSWGKVKPRARQVNIDADATIALPLMYAAVLSKLSNPRG